MLDVLGGDTTVIEEVKRSEARNDAKTFGKRNGNSTIHNSRKIWTQVFFQSLRNHGNFGRYLESQIGFSYGPPSKPCRRRTRYTRLTPWKAEDIGKKYIKKIVIIMISQKMFEKNSSTRQHAPVLQQVISQSIDKLNKYMKCLFLHLFNN